MWNNLNYETPMITDLRRATYSREGCHRLPAPRDSATFAVSDTQGFLFSSDDADLAPTRPGAYRATVGGPRSHRHPGEHPAGPGGGTQSAARQTPGVLPSPRARLQPWTCRFSARPPPPKPSGQQGSSASRGRCCAWHRGCTPGRKSCYYDDCCYRVLHRRRSPWSGQCWPRCWRERTPRSTLAGC